VSFSTAASGPGERVDSADTFKVVVGAGTDVITATMASLETAINTAVDNLGQIKELKLIIPLVVGVGDVVARTNQVAIELDLWADSLYVRKGKYRHLVAQFERYPEDDHPVLVGLLQKAVEAHKNRTQQMQSGAQLVGRLMELMGAWKEAETQVNVTKGLVAQKMTDAKKAQQWLLILEAVLAGAACALGVGCLIIGCQHFMKKREETDEEYQIAKNMIALACILGPVSGAYWRKACRDKIEEIAKTVLALAQAESASAEVLALLRAVHAQLSELLKEVQAQLAETGDTMKDTKMMVTEERDFSTETTATAMETSAFKDILQSGTDHTLLYLRRLESEKKSLLLEQLWQEMTAARKLKTQGEQWQETSVTVKARLSALTAAFGQQGAAKEESAQGKVKDQATEKE